MHGILAEDFTGIYVVSFGEIVVLLLALVAIFYAIRDERRRAIYLIVPAVIWVASFTLYDIYNAVKDILHGDRIISEFGLVHYIVGVVIQPWIVLAMPPFIMSLIVVSVFWLKSERVAGETKKKVVFATIYVFLLLFFLQHILTGPLFAPTSTDVAKRIKSPDGTKTALLIRRHAQRVSFAVQKEGLINRTLFSCGGFDFDPNVNTDYNERIIWSDDSTFIALLVDDVGGSRYDNKIHTVMWGYDFKNGKMCFNNESVNYGHNEIINTINSRSKKNKL